MFFNRQCLPLLVSGSKSIGSLRCHTHICTCKNLSDISILKLVLLEINFLWITQPNMPCCHWDNPITKRFNAWIFYAIIRTSEELIELQEKCSWNHVLFSQLLSIYLKNRWSLTLLRIHYTNLMYLTSVNGMLLTIDRRKTILIQLNFSAFVRAQKLNFYRNALN